MQNIIKKPQLAIIIPCYNEEEVLSESISRISVKIKQMIDLELIADTSFICCVDDGSKDKTWGIIEQFSNSHSVRGIKLSRNRGHQNALVAGLVSCESQCDITISIDSDLQDDIEVLNDFVSAYLSGNEIVYGVRKKRDKDTLFKKWTALGFYKFMQIFGVEIVFNHADYRLVSSRVLKCFNEYKEVNLFLRGIFPTIGHASTIVEYDRNERFAGESKYPLKKMISFALEGITSFSTTPLRLVSMLGMIVIISTILLSLWALIQHHRGVVVPGWSSTIISIYFLGAVQLLSIGLIGEYIGKIYKEVKARPRFFIENKLGF